MANLSAMVTARGATPEQAALAKQFQDAVQTALNARTAEGLPLFRGTGSVVMLSGGLEPVAVFESRKDSSGVETVLYGTYGDLAPFALRKAVSAAVLVGCGRQARIGSADNQEFLRALLSSVGISVYQGSGGLVVGPEKFFLGVSGFELSEDVLRGLSPELRKATCELGGGGHELAARLIARVLTGGDLGQVAPIEPELALVGELAKKQQLDPTGYGQLVKALADLRLIDSIQDLELRGLAVRAELAS